MKVFEYLVFTHFYDGDPGFLDYKYRIHSLMRRYTTLIGSNLASARTALDVPKECFFNLPSTPTNLFSLFAYFLRIHRLVNTLHARRIVFLHSFYAPMAWTCRKPFVLYWNEHPTHHYPVDPIEVPNLAKRLKNRVMLSLCYLSARRARSVMPVGEEQYFDLLMHDCSDKRTRLIPLGVHDDFLSSPRANRDPGPGANLLQVIHAGTVKRERGRDVMLEALATANAEKPRVHLTLVGADAAQIAYCEGKARDLGISPFLTIMGRVNGQEIPALLHSADVGICIWEDRPYWRFNPPTKLFEYLTAGLPVLASNIRTHTRYITDWQNGLIFEYDAQDLARKLIELFERPIELARMRESAASAGRKYIWSLVEPRFLDAIKLMDV